jgi:hypothetical protein
VGFWKRFLGKPDDEPLEKRLASLSTNLLSAYQAMRQAVEKQGLDGPDLDADAGIMMMPYVYLRRVMRLGADPNFKDSPRFYAQGTEFPEPYYSLGPRGPKLDANGVRALLDERVGPAPKPIPGLFFGFTALHLVAECDRVEAVSVLVERGVDPRALSERGETALHLSCRHGSWKTARALIAHDPEGVAIRTKNVVGYTPLGVCAVMNRPAGIDFLYEAGVRMDEGREEIRLAAEWGCRAAFERLCALSGIVGSAHTEFERILEEAERRASL